jgi:hypothetical protein
MLPEEIMNFRRPVSAAERTDERVQVFQFGDQGNDSQK